MAWDSLSSWEVLFDLEVPPREGGFLPTGAFNFQKPPTHGSKLLFPAPASPLVFAPERRATRALLPDGLSHGGLVSGVMEKDGSKYSCPGHQSLARTGEKAIWNVPAA